METDSVELVLGGYVRAFTGYLRPDTDAFPIPLGIPEEMGIHASVTRLELKLAVADVLAVEVHNRFYWQMMTDALAAGGGVGVGVSAPPSRSLDTVTDIVESGTHLLQHDLDRLALRFFLGPVDLYVGRQAVSWGVSNLFPVADLWTAFSPFDLDTSQKRGVDAVRVVAPLGDKVELDGLLVDRGRLDEERGWEDLGAGLRATFYLDGGDVYVAAAKQWEEIALLAGVSWNVHTVKLRAEAAGVYDFRAEEVKLPRVTAGADWFQSTDLVMGVEAHFNGAGVQADEVADYAEAQGLGAFFGRVGQGSLPLQRGEVYLSGRWYAGAYVTWKPYELVSLGASTLVNLTDPTAMLTWSAAYEVAQDVDISLGAFHGLGQGVEHESGGGLELGAYGQLFYLQLAAFF